MGRPVDVLKTIEKTKGRINSEYSMSIHDALNIKNSSKCTSEVAYNAFLFGYAQGVKAQKKGVAFHG